MKKLVLIISSLMIVSFSFSQTQLEMNENAKSSFEKVDKELNIIYKQIIEKYKPDSVFLKNLKISQRLWIQFRDAQLNMKYPEREPGYYGSMQPICFYSYKEELTNDRIKVLKEWITGFDEGDGCAGSAH